MADQLLIPVLPGVMVSIYEVQLIVLGLIVAIFAIAGVFIWYYYNLKKWAPEAPQIAECRRKRKPWNLTVHAGSGNAVSEVGNKGRWDKLEFKSKVGTKLDPAFTAHGEPVRLARGLEINIYGTRSLLPIGIQEAQAKTQIVRWVRKNFRRLGQLTDLQIITYLDTDEDNLVEDIGSVMKKAKWADPDTGELLTIEAVIADIKTAKDELGKLPVESGPALIPAALKLVSSAFSNVYYSEMKRIIRQQEADRAGLLKMQWMLTAAVAVSIVVMVVLAAISTFG